jgi:hypothetical protein
MLMCKSWRPEAVLSSPAAVFLDPEANANKQFRAEKLVHAMYMRCTWIVRVESRRFRRLPAHIAVQQPNRLRRSQDNVIHSSDAFSQHCCATV